MTPLERAPEAIAAGRDLYLKRKDTHEIGAFKWRGALPTLRIYAENGTTAVVTASTGNHGAATAWAARELELQAIVFVPERASETKVARIVALGAELRRVGRDFDDTKERAASTRPLSTCRCSRTGSSPHSSRGTARSAARSRPSSDAGRRQWSSHSGTAR